MESDNDVNDTQDGLQLADAVASSSSSSLLPSVTTM